MFRFLILCLLVPCLFLPALAQDTTQVRLLQDLAWKYIRKQERTPAILDSARIYIAKAAALSITLHDSKGEGISYRMYSTVYRLLNQPEKGHVYLNKAMDLFKKYNYKAEIGETFFEMSGYEPNDTDDGARAKILCYEKAVPYFEQVGDKKRVGDFEKGLGEFYCELGKYPEASIHLSRAETAYKSAGYKADLEGLYDLMGIVASMMSDYEQGVKYGLLALKTAKENKDSSLQLATIYNRLGLTYMKLSQFQDALNNYRLGLAIGEKYKDRSTVLVISGNIVSILCRMGGHLDEALALQQSVVKRYPTDDPSDQVYREIAFMMIYRYMKRYPEAQIYCNRALALSSRRKKDDSVQYVVYKSIIPFFLDTRQFDQARKYLVLNETYCLKQNTPKDLAENHYQWYLMDSTQGNYQSAIIHLRKTWKLNESIYKRTQWEQISQLRVKYETEQKDQDLQLKEQNIQLLIKKGQLQQTSLAKERTTRNAIIGGAVMLVLLLGLGYNRYRLKQRSNIQLTAQQKEINRQNHSLQDLINSQNKLLKEKEWLLKEIHHRVKNNLQFIISLLNMQSAYLDNDAAIAAIRESQSRMYAMSLIHQKLYHSDEISFIDMVNYIHEMVNYLSDSLIREGNVHFDLQLDDIELEAVQAAPVGLILNEAITNAIKYAFPGNRDGIITIKLRYTDTGEILLSISDNGTGLPTDVKKEGSLGMKLITTLSEQLEAKLCISNDNGLHISMLFAEEVYNTRLHPLPA
jgi:two-component sensor histidine kinase